MPKGLAARIGDQHVCPQALKVAPFSPHVGGPIAVAGLRTVFINGQMAATKNDTCVCLEPPNMITGGSGRVHINGQPAARVNDITSHLGSVSTGSPNVFIGD